MILVEGYFHFRHFPDEPPPRELGDIVLPIAEQAALRYLTAFDYPRRGEVVVEEGSTKVRAIVRTTAMVLLTYGGVRQAIDYARQDGRAAAGWVLRQVGRVLDVPSGARIASRRYTPGPTRLKRLFDSVEAGHLSAADAAARAEEIFAAHGEPPGTVAAVTDAVRQELGLLAPAQFLPRPPRQRVGVMSAARAALPGRRLRVYRDSTGRVQYVEE